MDEYSSPMERSIMKKRVMDLAGWIPQPGGWKAEGDRVPNPGDVFVERVVKVFDDHIMFTCKEIIDDSTGEARSLFYDFWLLDEKTRPEIEEILSANVGKTLLSIGPLEIPAH